MNVVIWLLWALPAAAFVTSELPPSYRRDDPPNPNHFVVDTLADTHDATLGDWRCADATGACSLRAAAEEVGHELDGPPYSDQGSWCYLYHFTIDLAVTGTIALTDDIVFPRKPYCAYAAYYLTGPGSDLLTIAGGGLAFEGALVELYGVTITGAEVGVSSSLLYSGYDVDLEIEDVVLTGNGFGLGLSGLGPYSGDGALKLTHVTVSGNRNGGAWIGAAPVSITDCDFSDNGGVGLTVSACFFDITDSRFTGNAGPGLVMERWEQGCYITLAGNFLDNNGPTTTTSTSTTTTSATSSSSTSTSTTTLEVAIVDDPTTTTSSTLPETIDCAPAALQRRLVAGLARVDRLRDRGLDRRADRALARLAKQTRRLDPPCQQTIARWLGAI